MRDELSPVFELINRLADTSYTLDVVILPSLEEYPVDFKIDDDVDALPIVVAPFLGSLVAAFGTYLNCLTEGPTN